VPTTVQYELYKWVKRESDENKALDTIALADDSLVVPLSTDIALVAADLTLSHIDHWVCPDVMRNQDISVAKAKKAISEYKKAIGCPEGLAELTVFYCESCMNLLSYCGMDDEGYFNALARMFEQALKTVVALEPSRQEAFVERLERVRREGHNWGWGVGDDMGDLMAEYEFAEE